MDAGNIRTGMLFLQEDSYDGKLRLWVTTGYRSVPRTWNCAVFDEKIAPTHNYGAAEIGEIDEGQLAGFKFCGPIPNTADLLAGCLLQERNPELKSYDEEDQEEEDLEDLYYGDGDDETEDM